MDKILSPGLYLDTLGSPLSQQTARTINPTGPGDIFFLWGNKGFGGDPPTSSLPSPSLGLNLPSPVETTWQLKRGGPASLAQARRVGSCSPIQPSQKPIEGQAPAACQPTQQPLSHGHGSQARCSGRPAQPVLWLGWEWGRSPRQGQGQSSRALLEQGQRWGRAVEGER